MTIINTSPDRIIQLGYEGEDRVTVLRFRYGADWLENGEGVFRIRVRRHGENHAYNAQLVTVDLTHMELLMTVTNTELSVKGAGEMQVVYSGADFVKKSPIYSYNVSRAVDEAVDPPAQDVYTEIIESLSDLQTDVQGKADVQTVSALADEITDLNSDVQGLQTIVQGKADTQTVTALSDTVSGLQTAMQGKADVRTVTALSGTVSSLSDTTQQYMEYTNSAITDLQDNKASKSYVDGELATKANVQTVTALSGTVTDLQDNKADKTYVDTELAGKASTTVATTSTNGLMSAQDKSKLDEVGLLKEQIYNSYPSVEAETASVVSITDGADDIPVKSLVVGVEPVQDLHGYDSPWPAGGGKNKCLPYTDRTSNNGITYTVTNDGISITGTATAASYSYGAAYSYADSSIRLPSGTYTFSSSAVPGSAQMYGYLVFMRVTESGTATSNIVLAGTTLAKTVTFSEPVGIFYGFYVASGQTVNVNCKIMIEAGSTKTDFATYSNICPISGFDSVKVSRTGVNVWDEEWEAGAYSGTTGEKITNTTNMRCKNAIPIKPNTAYYIKSPYAMYVFEYSADGTYLGYTTILNNTMTTKANSCYMRFYLLAGYGTTYNNDISINYPSTAAAYEPYQGQTYDIEFPSEAGTVYGGTLDVVSGELVVDRTVYTFDGTEAWTASSTPNRFSTKLNYLPYPMSNPPMTTGAIQNALTSVFGRCVYKNEDGFGYLVRQQSGDLFVVNISSVATVDGIKAVTTGMQLCYELAEPQTCQLTPTEVRTLLGQNNIWTDTGDTSLAYRADTRLYVDGICADCNSMLAPVESTYTATRNYTTGQLLIVDNTLYKVTANIANGGTITAGTNVVSTTLSEVIASLS